MTANDLDRRAFVRTAGALLLAGSGFRFAPAPRAQHPLRIAVAPPLPGPAFSAATSAARGVTLGVEEAARTGQLVGREIEIMLLDYARVAARAGMMPAAVIGGFDEAECRMLSALASQADILFMNVGCRADGTPCGRNVFHVEASAQMYAAALASRGEDASDATEAVLWHPALERFGAGQLNDRYRARFGDGMDAPAWAGWMAVKALWEASLRARSTEPAGLRDYLERGATQFDGHKGWPLSFRAWDHRLRQPLYLVVAADNGGTRVVGEVPTRRSDEESSSRELLDRVGADASASACGMGR
jgi:ABC-type branched-subunit amino acid transport system substrate-binding protein